MVWFAFDVVEQDRAPAIHVLLQSSDLKVGIDLFVGFDQFTRRAQPFQRAAQIESVVRHRWRVVLAQLLLHRSRSHCIEF
jgi:hypothetical protein